MDDTNLAASIGARIRKVRAEQDKSQEQLALAAGISRAYMGSIERGERKLSVASIARIAVALRVEVSALFPPLITLSGDVPDEVVSSEVDAIQRGQRQRLRRRQRKEQREQAIHNKSSAVVQSNVEEILPVVASVNASDSGSEGVGGEGGESGENGIEQALLTTGAAANRLGVSSRTLERWARSGKIPSMLLEDKAGKVYTLFRVADIEKALHRVHRHTGT